MHGPNAFWSNGDEHAPSQAQACSADSRASLELQRQKSVGPAWASAEGHPGARASTSHKVSKFVEWNRSTQAETSAKNAAQDRRRTPDATTVRLRVPEGMPKNRPI